MMVPLTACYFMPGLCGEVASKAINLYKSRERAQCCLPHAKEPREMDAVHWTCLTPGGSQDTQVRIRPLSGKTIKIQNGIRER